MKPAKKLGALVVGCACVGALVALPWALANERLPKEETALTPTTVEFGGLIYAIDEALSAAVVCDEDGTTEFLYIANESGSALVVAAASPKNAADKETVEKLVLDKVGQDVPAVTGTSAPGEATLWVSEEECISCHQAEGQSVDDDATLCATHAALLSCTDCHDDFDVLAQCHEGATADKATSVRFLKRTDVEVETCVLCHNPTDLAEKTADSTAVIDDNGTTVNPHDLPDSAREHAYINCVKCHQMHKASDAAYAANDYCMGCHHDGIYECGTCHD